MAAIVHSLSVAKNMLDTWYGNPLITAVISLVRYSMPLSSVLGVEALNLDSLVAKGVTHALLASIQTSWVLPLGPISLL